jgi:hypothetical protein
MPRGARSNHTKVPTAPKPVCPEHLEQWSRAHYRWMDERADEAMTKAHPKKNLRTMFRAELERRRGQECKDIGR